MRIRELLGLMVEKDASDLFFRAGGLPRLRIDGKVTSAGEENVSLDDIEDALNVLASEKQREKFDQTGDVDFAIYFDEFTHRFRVSIFIQRNTPSIVIRCVPNVIRSFEELNLPGEVLKGLATESRGLVLLTGTMGSGKSTAIATMIEHINCHLRKHVLTFEEPIEYTFKDKQSIINQRDLGLDVASYEVALKALTLQSPDVIYVGTIRDQETMKAVLNAAETGVLVLSTLHTVNAPQSIEKMINFFPPHQHGEVRTQLSLLLKGIISLRLVPRLDKLGRLPAYEVMLRTPTIGRLIREGKIWETPHYIEEGQIFGMVTFPQVLVKLVKEGKVAEEEAYNFVDNKDEFQLMLKGIKKA